MRANISFALSLAKCASGCATETIYTACLLAKITFAGTFTAYFPSQ